MGGSRQEAGRELEASWPMGTGIKGKDGATGSIPASGAFSHQSTDLLACGWGRRRDMRYFPPHLGTSGMRTRPAGPASLHRELGSLQQSRSVFPY